MSPRPLKTLQDAIRSHLISISTSNRRSRNLKNHRFSFKKTIVSTPFWILLTSISGAFWPPRRAQERPRPLQERPRRLQDRPTTALGPPKTPPRPPQEAPKSPPRGLQEGFQRPRCSKRAPGGHLQVIQGHLEPCRDNFGASLGPFRHRQQQQAAAATAAAASSSNGSSSNR